MLLGAADAFRDLADAALADVEQIGCFGDGSGLADLDDCLLPLGTQFALEFRDGVENGAEGFGAVDGVGGGCELGDDLTDGGDGGAGCRLLSHDFRVPPCQALRGTLKWRCQQRGGEQTEWKQGPQSPSPP
uniref:Uncharacterized protein n=1 Tax=Streptomyces sp. HK1 TaxID=405041 RepID=B0LTZ0_9ACTN|nr:unknown [Streptomyces sp. HK1]